MTIKLIADSLDEVPESLREQATEVGGKFELDGSGLVKKNAELLTKVSGLKTAKESLAKFEGIDPDAARHALERVAEFDKDPSNKPANEQTLLAKWNLDKEREVRPLREENESLKGEVRKFKLTDRVKDIAVKAGVMPKYVDHALKVTEGHFKLGEGDKILILDAEGDLTGTTLEQFWGETWKAENGIYYAPSGAGGSGAKAGFNGSQFGGVKTVKRGDQEALNGNIEAIAKGEVQVVD